MGICSKTSQAKPQNSQGCVTDVTSNPITQHSKAPPVCDWSYWYFLPEPRFYCSFQRHIKTSGSLKYLGRGLQGTLKGVGATLNREWTLTPLL